MATERDDRAGVPSAALRRWIDAQGRMPPELRAEGARRVTETAARAARGRGWRRHRTMAVGAAATVLVTAAAVGIGIDARRHASPSSSISYRVESGRVGPHGAIEIDEGEAHVRFSDGTDVDVPRGAKVAVRDTDAEGARIGIGDGRVHFDVVHRASTRWLVLAGPFQIAVTGTSFTAEWSDAEQELRIAMERGSVEITGPLSDGPIVLRSGQRLVARARERETVIRELEDQDAGPPVPSGAAPVLPTLPSPPPEPVRRAPPRGRPATEPAPARASAGAEADWAAELSSGRSAAIVARVEARGMERALGEASATGLSAIADAARFEQRFDLARAALLALRRRFPSSPQARDGAFLLGRVEEADGDVTAGLAWYETYVREAPSGAYVPEALGRQMNLSEQLHGPEGAYPLARRYIERFPDGAYAPAARALLARARR